MSTPLRLGFVGVGMMGQMAHLRNYVLLPDCEVVALSDLRPVLAHRVAERYGVPRVYGNAAEMLAHEELDALVAAQPFVQHGSIITPLYQANLPVFTEKALASSVPVGEAMLAALGQTKAWHMVGYHKRSDPAVMWAKAEMARLKNSGELGKLRYIRLTMPGGDWTWGGLTGMLTSDEPHPVLDADAAEPGFDEATNNRYLTILNGYSHQINLLRHLLGEDYAVTHADPSGLLLVAESASGVCGVIEVAPYSVAGDWQESVLIGFERGYIKIELPAPLAQNRPGRVEVFYQGGEGTPWGEGTPSGEGALSGEGTASRTVVPQLPWVHAMRQQAINFLRAVRGEIPPMCDAAEALEDIKVARDYVRLLTGSKA